MSTLALICDIQLKLDLAMRAAHEAHWKELGDLQAMIRDAMIDLKAERDAEDAAAIAVQRPLFN